jgi:hypothetical protein
VNFIHPSARIRQEAGIGYRRPKSTHRPVNFYTAVGGSEKAECGHSRLLYSGYPQTHAKAYKEMHAAIDGDHAVCEFKDVTPSTYAVIVFHDENQNGKLDKNFIGVPQEGYAASNNVRHLMSAP